MNVTGADPVPGTTTNTKKMKLELLLCIQRPLPLPAKTDQLYLQSNRPPHHLEQKGSCNCNVTCRVKSSRSRVYKMNMTMCFTVSFVLLHLICAVTNATATINSTSPTADGKGSISTSSFLNEPIARPTPRLADQNLNITVSIADGQLLGDERQGMGFSGSAVTAGNSHVPRMMSGNDMLLEQDNEYVQDGPQAASSHKTDSIRASNIPPKWPTMNQQREHTSTDFQEHFYLNPKFKEKDVPVPFTFSNFKRQQQQQPSSNVYTSAPFMAYQGQPQSPRGRPSSSWSSGQAPTMDPTFTREITIKQGRIKGIVRAMYRDSGIRDVDQFLGLPYAESPVGNKRFMPPGKTLCTF